MRAGIQDHGHFPPLSARVMISGITQVTKLWLLPSSSSRHLALQTSLQEVAQSVKSTSASERLLRQNTLEAPSLRLAIMGVMGVGWGGGEGVSAKLLRRTKVGYVKSREDNRLVNGLWWKFYSFLVSVLSTQFLGQESLSRHPQIS